MSRRLARRLQALRHPQPLGPVCAAPLRWRRSNYDTNVAAMQPLRRKNLGRKEKSLRTQAKNYFNVSLELRKDACIVSTMETTKALRAIANMSGRESITQPDAAHVLGVSRATIARREKQGWPLTELLELADAYNVSRTRLMLQLGYLDDTDLYAVVGDGTLEGVPLSALTSELHKRATDG